MAKKSTNKAKENSVAANVEVGGNIGGNLIMGHGNIVNLAPDQISFRALHQLPPAPADFTGREAELKQILENLNKNKGPSISGLTGMGGIGKTALGLVAAHEIAGKYPDAQIFLDLKGVSEPLSPADVMRHVILSFEPTSDLREFNDNQLAALYQSTLSEKKALLFLDNALDASQVRFLIPPNTCSLIVTSRRSFALPGMDKPIRLDVLPEKKAVQLLKRLCKRIKGSANEVAKLCGYIPLALQIAGTFLAVHSDWSPEQYINRLIAQRLKLLKGEDDDPKYDLEAAIGLSYAQLTDNEQKYWRILSVFPSAFRRDAAMAIWELGENMVQDLLSKLNRISLLDYDEKAKRYSLHDLLVDYAISKTENAEEQEAHLKHAFHYKDVMESVNNSYLEGGDKVLIGLRLFDLEWEHIRIAQAWVAENIETSEQIAELAMLYPDASVYCLDLRLAPKHKIEWLKLGVIAARKLEKKEYEAAYLDRLGLVYADLGETRKAIEYHEKSLMIKHEIGDRLREGITYGNLGSAHYRLSNMRQAIEFYEQALAIAQENGDRRSEGIWLGNLGNVYLKLGDVRKAVEFYEQDLAIAREIGDHKGEGSSLNNLGSAYADLGEARKAIEYHEESLTIAREIGDRLSEGSSLCNLGKANADLGDMHKAIELYEQALTIAREIGNRRVEGKSLGNLGNVYFTLGELYKAIEVSNQASAIAHEIGDKGDEVKWLGNLGVMHKKLGNPQKSIEFYGQALLIAREISDQQGEASTLFNIGLTLYSLEEKDRAIDLVKQALKIYAATELPTAEKARNELKEWGALE